jgi:hypothetical protein
MLTNTRAGTGTRSARGAAFTPPERDFPASSISNSVTRDGCVCSERRYSLTSLSLRPVEHKIRVPNTQ